MFTGRDNRAFESQQPENLSDAGHSGESGRSQRVFDVVRHMTSEKRRQTSVSSDQSIKHLVSPSSDQLNKIASIEEVGNSGSPSAEKTGMTPYQIQNQKTIEKTGMTKGQLQEQRTIERTGMTMNKLQREREIKKIGMTSEKFKDKRIREITGMTKWQLQNKISIERTGMTKGQLREQRTIERTGMTPYQIQNQKIIEKTGMTKGQLQNKRTIERTGMTMNALQRNKKLEKKDKSQYDSVIDEESKGKNVEECGRKKLHNSIDLNVPLEQ